MRNGIRMIGILSILLIMCVLVGNGIWLTKMKEVKIDGYAGIITFTLSQAIDEYLGAESANRKYGFACGLLKDEKSFIWKNDTIKVPSYQNFDAVMRKVFYDFLYEKHIPYLKNIESIYKEKLLNLGIEEQPVLMVLDSIGQTIMLTDSLYSFEGKILSKPIDVGYKCKHQFIAAIPEPPIFQSMIWHLIVEVIFLFSFIVCLIWQWKITSSTLKSAKVQTLGMAHLEHELKKPLSTMISAIGGIITRKNEQLTEVQDRKLKLVMARLMKMEDVTDTMMAALKTEQLKIVRKEVYVRQEMELMVEMFAELRPHAKVEFSVEEGIGSPLLDTVYFNHLVSNLIDNAIKYGGDEPEVKVWFGKDVEGWLLTVEDNGIGMPKAVLKKIFRQFYRVKDKRVEAKTGFGLGLAFVKKVVNAYGGEIKVESEPGKGTRFEIKLK